MWSRRSNSLWALQVLRRRRHGHEHAAVVRHQAPAPNLKKQTAPFNSKSPQAESVKMNVEKQATNKKKT
jgi:hypothetical protein